VIPDAFGINYCDGTTHADAQTVCFGAENQRLWPDQAKLFESVFEKFPGHHPLLFRTTFRFGLIGAEKNVPPEFLQSEFFNLSM